MNHELRTTNYQLNTSDESRATSDKFALFWSFYVVFCAFCASLRLKRTVFSCLKIKVCPKGLHNFAFYILIFNFSPCFCASLWLKNPFNQRNPRLINDLRSTKDYVRNYKLFMQNEPKFRKSQMNVTNLITKDYEKRTLGQLGKTNPKRTQTNPKRTQNEPNSNPNKANFRISQNSSFLQLFLVKINMLMKMMPKDMKRGCPIDS